MTELIFESKGVRLYAKDERVYLECQKDKSFPDKCDFYGSNMLDTPTTRSLLLKYAHRSAAGALFPWRLID